MGFVTPSWAYTEFEALAIICTNLSLSGCTSEYPAIREIVESELGSAQDAGWRETRLLAEWCFSYSATESDKTFTEVQSLRCLGDNIVGSEDYSSWTEAPLYTLLADNSPFAGSGPGSDATLAQDGSSYTLAQDGTSFTLSQ